jgi:hypothetical protein
MERVDSGQASLLKQKTYKMVHHTLGNTVSLCQEKVENKIDSIKSTVGLRYLSLHRTISINDRAVGTRLPQKSSYLR